jgi:hypothetical protein
MIFYVQLWKITAERIGRKLPPGFRAGAMSNAYTDGKKCSNLDSSKGPGRRKKMPLSFDLCRFTATKSGRSSLVSSKDD